MGTSPLPRVFRRLPLVSLLLAPLLAPPPAAAVEAREVLRYDLFSHHALATSGEMEAVAAPDGHVLLVWSAWAPGTHLQTVWAQWLAPDGTPSGGTVVVSRGDGVEGVAVRSGRRALLVTRDWETGSAPHVVTLAGERVVRRGTFPDPECDRTRAVTATEVGYFVVCDRFSGAGWEGSGWWLDGAGRGRHRVDVEGEYDVAAAGGIRSGVALLYRHVARGPLYARWLTPWRSGPEVVVDPAPSPSERRVDPSITHLRGRVFALSWLHEHDHGFDSSGDSGWRVTAVHEATFRAPGTVRAERRFSGSSEGLVPGVGFTPVAEHRRPFVLRTGDREQLVGWFGCAYHGSPGGLLCFEHDGLFLRDRRGGGPDGGVLHLPGVAAGSRVVYTGEVLLAVRLVRAGLNVDRWSLEVRGWVVE